MKDRYIALYYMMSEINETRVRGCITLDYLKCGDKIHDFADPIM